MDKIRQGTFDCIIGMLPEAPAPVRAVGRFIYSNPLTNRVTKNWKVLLMDCSTIIACTAVFFTYVYGRTLYCTALSIVALASLVSSFYMRRFDELKDLGIISNELRAERDNIQGVASQLKGENASLKLTRDDLTARVATLTTQLADLGVSAGKIRDEVCSFHKKNAALGANLDGFEDCLQVFDAQISASKTLSTIIADHLNSHDAALGENVKVLGEYLVELRSENSVTKKIEQVGLLHQQTQLELKELQGIKVQIAQERGKLEEVRKHLVDLHAQYEKSMKLNNEQLQSNISGIATERVRIQQLLNKYFPQPGPAPSSARSVPSGYPHFEVVVT